MIKQQCPMYSIESYIQYPMTSPNGKHILKECVYICCIYIYIYIYIYIT